MNCSVCREPATESITAEAKVYPLCAWDARRVSDMLEGIQSNHMVNIFWGAGHVNWTCWATIRDYLRKYNVTEVLELGIGLSSELFVNEGIKVVGFDVCKEHVELYQNLKSLKGEAKFHHYEEGTLARVIEQIYPGRMWDFVFVDGPQERSHEVKLAMRRAYKFIYLHDPNLGEESFFPTYEWKGVETEPKFFIKQNTCRECSGLIEDDVDFCEEHQP